MSEPLEYPDDLVTLTTAANEFEAGTIVATLNEAGIEAVAFSTTQLLGLGDLAGQRVPVQVRRADLERADAAIKQRVADSVDLDWSEVDVGQVEDDVPIAHPHETRNTAPMPLVVKLGFLLAVFLVLLMLALGVATVLMRWL